MQETMNPSPSWSEIALGIIAVLLGGGGIYKAYDVWLNRKKPTADLHISEATATEITVRTHLTAAQGVASMMKQLMDAQETIDRLRRERDEMELKAFDLQMELRDSRDANRQLMAQAKLDNHQLGKQMAFIVMKNLKDEYVALDVPKEKL